MATALAAMVDDLVAFFTARVNEGMSLREAYIATVEEFDEPHDVNMVRYRKRQQREVIVQVHDSDAPDAATPILERSEAIRANDQEKIDSLLQEWGKAKMMEDARFKVCY